MVCRLRNSSVLSRLPLLCNSQELQIKLSYWLTPPPKGYWLNMCM
jgi:hypothetical protein